MRLRLYCLSGILLLLYPLFSAAQQQEDKGTQLRQQGKLKEAILAFRAAYRENPSMSGNTYKLAQAYALDHQPDSAFLYLYRAANLYLNEDALTDPELYLLRSDKRWDNFEKQLIAGLAKKNRILCKDCDYARKLWRMYCGDQAYYKDIEAAEQQSVINTALTDTLWMLKNKINEQNQLELEALIAEKGWPKESEVGETAASAAFLVIQHSDSARQKKYLPLIKQRCEEQEASWQSYALMYDRVQTAEGKPQRYGSQVRMNEQTKAYELFPLEDEQQVDKWRAEAGMGPLADYVQHWNIIFPTQKK